MTPEEQEYEQTLNALIDEEMELLRKLRELTRNKWRSGDKDQAAYIEEVKRRQPSAFRTPQKSFWQRLFG